MTIRTEFINFIVSRAAIEAKYPGGWGKFLIDQGFQGTNQRGRFWHDDYLYRNGAMNPIDMQSLVERWEQRGFVGLQDFDGTKIWTDFCVYEGFWPMEYECPWLARQP